MEILLWPLLSTLLLFANKIAYKLWGEPREPDFHHPCYIPESESQLFYLFSSVVNSEKGLQSNSAMQVAIQTNLSFLHQMKIIWWKKNYNVIAVSVIWYSVDAGCKISLSSDDHCSCGKRITNNLFQVHMQRELQPMQWQIYRWVIMQNWTITWHT